MAITLSNASFEYANGSLAVDRVSLTVAAGERLAIVGQNGAGKTTTVKLMNGLLKPTSGSVTVDGVDTLGQTTAATARRVAYVFQNPDDQIFGSTVQEELEYLGRRAKWDTDVLEDRVSRAARLAGLESVLDENPSDLPPAIKKFVAIGAVLVGDAKYLILDEPTAGLDMRGLHLLNEMIDKLESEGTAVVTITHDMRFVADSFRRVVVMANRQVLADGDVESVFAADAILHAAKLQRPVGARIARELGFATDRLNLKDLASLIAGQERAS
jgi:energy-coupling factor transport system ATP-binding protein